MQDSDLVSMSLMDVGVLSFSTLISVLVHEFGHAIAAARSAFLVTIMHIPFSDPIKETLFVMSYICLK